MPATPNGAVAARSITSWRRDPRYLSSVALMLLLPLGPLWPELRGGSSSWSLAMPPGGRVPDGWSTHKDIAYDGTAFWAHLAAGCPAAPTGSAGWLAPIALVATFLLAEYATLACALTGRWSLWPGALLGVALAILLSGSAWPA
jgi:ABC-2 type transport system permease protein